MRVVAEIRLVIEMPKKLKKAIEHTFSDRQKAIIQLRPS